MTSKKKRIQELSEIKQNYKSISVKNFIRDNALPYAYYVITDRALIAEDGLKPVNRRLIYSMFLSGATPTGKTIKAGTIASNVMGHYHPHGNTSIEAALARMGQTFSQRVPLVDVQGSVGAFTGDSPAAARYWEAKLSKAGYELIKEISDNASEMKPNFDETKEEPVYLPIKWPVGIINGSEGIAVGYASTIYPHNPDEVMDASIARVKGKIKDSNDLMKYIKGPDFPTGGEIIGIDGITDYINNGSGTFTVRGKYTIEPGEKGKHDLVFYELPYQVSAESVIESIRNRQDKGQLKDISEVKDLSGMKTGLKLSIAIKAGANPKSVLEDIWKYTPCQSKLSSNMTALINGKPVRNLPLIALIDQFLEFRKECFARAKTYQKEQIEKELTKVLANLAILLDIDKAIDIIRNSEDAESAKSQLEKHFNLNEEQSEFILQMRLRTLTKSDRNTLKSKQESLESELEHLDFILTNEEEFIKEIIKDLENTKKTISSPRRTNIINMTNEELSETTKANEKQERLLAKGVKCNLYLTNDLKVIKTIEKIDEKVSLKSMKEVGSQDDIYILSKDGYTTQMNVSSIPIDTPTNIRSLGVEPKNFSNILSNENNTLIVTNFGNVIVIKNDKIKSGSMVTLLPMESIIFSEEITKEDLDSKTLGIVSDKGVLTRFPLSQVRSVNYGSSLVSGMKDSICVDACIISKDDYIVTVGEKTVKSVPEEDVPTKSRGGKGSMIHKPSDESIKAIYSVNSEKYQIKLDNEIVEFVEPSVRGNKGQKFKSLEIGLIH